MPLSAICSLIGLLLGVLGAGLLAVSLNRLLGALALASKAHDFAIEQIAAPRGDMVILTGTNTHIARGEKRGTALVRIGLWLVVGSFFGQALGVLLSLP